MRKKIKAKSEREQNLPSVKFLKLRISKFQRTHLDWQRFWSQFEREIDRAEFARVTKCNFLKEMSKLKVRVEVSGLLFTTEDYERAKNILKSKYGKDSEVANAHIQSLISLLKMTSSNPYKSMDYTKNLSPIFKLLTLWVN